MAPENRQDDVHPRLSDLFILWCMVREPENSSVSFPRGHNLSLPLCETKQDYTQRYEDQEPISKQGEPRWP